MKQHTDSFLLGSTFPLSLIRRKVAIEPRPITELITAVSERNWVSFWGHDSTVAVASKLLCAGLKPKQARPAVLLNDDNYPMLDGVVFKECWVLSPDYVAGFRPEIGVEVPMDKISGWQALRIIWEI